MHGVVLEGEAGEMRDGRKGMRSGGGGKEIEE